MCIAGYFLNVSFKCWNDKLQEGQMEESEDDDSDLDDDFGVGRSRGMG